jgi:hypothetical protein
MRNDFIERIEAAINHRLLNTEDKVMITSTFVLSSCSSEGINLAISVKMKTLVFSMNEKRKITGNFCHVNKIVICPHGSFFVISRNHTWRGETAIFSIKIKAISHESVSLFINFSCLRKIAMKINNDEEID